MSLLSNIFVSKIVHAEGGRGEKKKKEEGGRYQVAGFTGGGKGGFLSFCGYGRAGGKEKRGVKVKLEGRGSSGGKKEDKRGKGEAETRIITTHSNSIYIYVSSGGKKREKGSGNS